MRVDACPPDRIECLPAEITLEVSHLPAEKEGGFTAWFVRKGADCPIKLSVSTQTKCEATLLLPEKLADCGPGIYEIYLQDAACTKLCSTDVEFIAECKLLSATVKESSDVKKDCPTC